ncbi:high frequency lysogenization protein HflD [Alkalimarinus sediminis]|uniref:High frequency lysogenization protein HflD homolog n=1 Tax=Alkalimarinus sediminis TaxID=1632866 RepID=A0A9E8KKG2_9ALTE|nr:high frequency lysogenization protein HflD [Alkalimarinus sediminis]UZW76116.1 high frequency lysogenization protein HflD [Alkalimarinus sediminis]
MNHTIDEQVIALSGIFQAAALVHQIAQTSRYDKPLLESSISSLFVTNPNTTVEVYKGIDGVQLGLETIQQILQKDTDQKNIEVIRYALSLIHLESKLRRKPDMLNIIGSRIDQASVQAEHFSLLHENVIHNLASLYMDTISTFNLRVQVTGKPEYLKISHNAALIRATLLAGIRAAILWRQTGGRRWNLLFKRRSIEASVKRQLSECSQSF